MKEGWTVKELKTMSKIMYGHTAKSSNEIKGPKYLRITDIQNDNVDWNNVPSCPPLEDDYQKYKLGFGDIVFARTGATTGKSFLVKKCPESVFASYLVRVQSDQNEIYPDFLYMFFQSSAYWAVIESGISGSAQGGFNAKKLGTIPIPIPPLSEQKQIVAILDETFTAINRAKANIEKNIENARELFQNKLNEIFSQKGDGWEEKKLGQACEISMGQSPKGTSYNSENVGTPLINGPVEFGSQPFSQTIMSKWTTEPTKLCAKGDLILCVRGSTTGRINIAGFNACIGRGVASIRYKNNQEWLNYFIRFNQKNIYNLGTGSTFPNVSKEILSKMIFPEPSTEKQNEFVGIMKSLDLDLENIEKNYIKKIVFLEHLKKSLLQKAFAGELT